MSKARTRLAVVALAALFGAVLSLGAGPAQAQVGVIEILVDTVAYEDGPLASAPVPAHLQGTQCDVSYGSINNDSVHPGNDLIVSSGSDQVVLENVEDEPGKITNATGTLVLGAEVVVSLRLGPDGVFSAGDSVVIDCVEVTPTSTSTTTTTTEAPTTTAAPPTTVAPTTTVPTQVGGIQESPPAQAQDGDPSFTG